MNNKKQRNQQGLGLRILCLNNTIPKNAPNGPRADSINRLADSGILPPSLIAQNLSKPKRTIESKFTAINTIRRAGSKSNASQARNNL